MASDEYGDRNELPDLIVIRETNSRFDGMWFDRAQINRPCNLYTPSGRMLASMPLQPIFELEIRRDGAIAQVWVPA